MKNLFKQWLIATITRELITIILAFVLGKAVRDQERKIVLKAKKIWI
jgi:hypothetical protein